jgi:hypothetical protein
MRLVVLAVLLMTSCKPTTSSQSVARLVDAAPAGDVAPIVTAQMSASAASGRTTLVYVGAAWCEPCERFRDAAKKGELNDVFGKVDFLVFDLDKDAARLDAAGYASRMIPLVVVPGADGRGTDRHIEGSIKGEGAVADMKPRVQALLGAR